MPTLRSMVVLMASSSVRRNARASLTSLSVSAVTGAVAAWSLAGTSVWAGLVVTVVGSGAGVGFLVVCAEVIVAANRQTMISRRRTAVMQVLLRHAFLRKAMVRVSDFETAFYSHQY